MVVITELLTYKIVQKYKRQIKDKEKKLKGASPELTTQQLRILQLLAKGYTEKEMAKELYVSSNTIKYHKKTIFKKLNLQSSKEAVAKAVHLGLINLE